MTTKIWNIQKGGGAPLVAAAIHNGHPLRRELHQYLALPEADRLREEDPFTAEWTNIAETRIVGLRSRFELDLNRPRNKAVYLAPEDAWGLQVWKRPLPQTLLQRSLTEYDAFYHELHMLFSELERCFKHIVVFDLHSYNHRRGGPEAPSALQSENPDINLGTGSMDREYWTPIIDRFIQDLRHFDFDGRQLDVRENVKFMGGQFPRWTHQHFPHSVCVLAVEVKKFFMDEWTGAVDRRLHNLLQQALASTVPGVLDALQQV